MRPPELKTSPSLSAPQERGAPKLGGDLLQYGLDTLEGLLQAWLKLDHVDDESVHCTAKLLFKTSHSSSRCDWDQGE